MKTYQVGDEVIIPERRTLRVSLRNCHGKQGVVKKVVIHEGFYIEDAPLLYIVEIEGGEYEVFPVELQLKPGPKPKEGA